MVNKTAAPDGRTASLVLVGITGAALVSRDVRPQMLLAETLHAYLDCTGI